MKDMLTYLLWPNPPYVSYDNPKLVALFVVSAGLVLASITLRMWRKKLTDSVIRRLSRSWPVSAAWFGITGMALAVSRAEQISYLSMRLWWVVWLLVLILNILFQVKVFRMRYYKKLPVILDEDPKLKYLPVKKKGRK